MNGKGWYNCSKLMPTIKYSKTLWESISFDIHHNPSPENNTLCSSPNGRLIAMPNKKLPYEILKIIVKYLDPNDQLNALTVCKAWQLPVAEALHEQVEINSKSKLQQFLSKVEHIGQHIQFLSFGADSNSEVEEIIDAASIERIAYSCANLRELGVHSEQFWNYAAQLDFSKVWLRLNGLRFLKWSKGAAQVLDAIKDRVTMLFFVLQGSGDLPYMPQLRRLYIIDASFMINDAVPEGGKFLAELAEKAPNLQILNAPDISMLDYKPFVLPQDGMFQSLKTLDVDIEDSKSAWLPVIINHCPNLTKLSVGIHNYRQSEAAAASSRALIDVLPKTIRLKRQTEFRLSGYDTHQLSDYAIKQLAFCINNDSKWNALTIISKDRPEIVRFTHTPMQTSTYIRYAKRSDVTLQNRFEESLRDKDVQIAKLSSFSEMKVFSRQNVVIDKLLEPFPHISKLSIAAENIHKKEKIWVSASDDFTEDTGLQVISIEHLRLEGIQILDRIVIVYLLVCSTKLKTIELEDCFVPHEVFQNMKIVCDRHNIRTTIEILYYSNCSKPTTQLKILKINTFFLDLD
ncbi:hypothetical protein BDF20DRAFT_990644 [Mycotypha africana]|uniref:uncharacterized protein n=1 Tax=Mycotypha africana TaxID=64632 RepID=UPI00230061A2|nr:uncharacterized protein BDF20DRAFT_990644 [Mycotypha africana]KAI8970386.1 hypothetical protein BDF20DRAFT_990644 [Mycotypha africana]